MQDHDCCTRFAYAKTIINGTTMVNSTGRRGLDLIGALTEKKTKKPTDEMRSSRGNNQTHMTVAPDNLPRCEFRARHDSKSRGTMP